MKKNYLAVIALFLVTSIFVFASCSSDDDNSSTDSGTIISYGELPNSSQQFITDHFNGYNVQEAVKNNISYNVLLQKTTTKTTLSSGAGYKVEFDLLGNWIEIEGRYESALPDNVLALIPRSIVSYVTQNYNQRSINEIKKETYGYKIELAGKPDIELQFDELGTFIGHDDDNDDVVIGLSQLPVISQTFLSSHFNGQVPSKITKDNDGYEVKLVTKFEIEFDVNGNFTKVDADDNTMPQTIVALLPAKLTNYLSTNYSNRRIKEIKVKVSFYEIELNGDVDLVFDKNGDVWSIDDDGKDSDQYERVAFSALPQTIQTYLNLHFLSSKQTTFLYAEKDNDKYEVKLANGTDVDFFIDGNLKKVEVLPNNNVPQSVILPAIVSYIQSNYPNKKIEEFEVKKNKGYKVELSGYPETELLFNINGNFIGMD